MTDPQAAATLRSTPLRQAHLDAGARMVPFAGWEMPVHYGSALEEHLAPRRSCGLFDVSHMGQVLVTGRGATALVQAIVTRDISKLADGQQAYTLLCADDGGILDDLIVARLAADRWLIIVNAGPRVSDVERMREIARRLGPADADLHDDSDNWAMIAVQGPEWQAVCTAVLGEGEWATLRPFRIAESTFQGAPLLISTTGYTGERGCELLCPPAQAPALWDALRHAGGRPVGLAARDSLRLEMGYCLSGQDFTVANNPFEAGLQWVVDLEKGDFAGAEALRRMKVHPIRQRLMGLLVEGRRIPRHGAKILGGEATIGEVTSGGWSPVLERPVAMGYVATGKAEIGTRVAIDLGGGKTVEAMVTRPPFVKKEKA